MIKLNFAFLLAVLVAFGGDVFAMDAGLGDSTVIVPRDGDQPDPLPAPAGSGAPLSTTPAGSGTGAPIVDSNPADVPADSATSSKGFFTKTKVAVIGFVGAAIVGLIYKYIVDNKPQQDNNAEDIIV